MQNDDQEKPSGSAARTPNQNPQPTAMSHGMRGIQPTADFAKEMQAQQSQPAVSQPTQPAPAQPVVTPVVQPVAQTAQVQPSGNGEVQPGMSASQMGLNQPKSHNTKGIIIKALIVFAVLAVVAAAYMLANIFLFNKFKTVTYTTNKGTNFKLAFYAKHDSKSLPSGSSQLVSKTSQDNKFPVAFSISEITSAGYDSVKDCGSYSKVFDVQDDNLEQKIAVCDLGKQNSIYSGAVYLAGFTNDNKYFIATIAQDYSGIDLSNQNSAQESLKRFGLEPYHEDLKKIVSSIKTE